MDSEIKICFWSDWENSVYKWVIDLKWPDLTQKNLDLTLSASSFEIALSNLLVYIGLILICVWFNFYLGNIKPFYENEAFSDSESSQKSPRPLADVGKISTMHLCEEQSAL